MLQIDRVITLKNKLIVTSAEANTSFPCLHIMHLDKVRSVPDMAGAVSTRAVFGCGGVNLPQGKFFIPIIFPQQFYPIKMFGLGANMVGE